MYNKLYIPKKFIVIAGIALSLFIFTNKASAADLYSSPANNGVIWSTVDILPSVTLSQTANPTFTVSGQLTSSSTTLELVSLTASNNSGPEAPIIPSILGNTLSLTAGSSTATSTTMFATPTAGSYSVTFTTYVDITPSTPQCWSCIDTGGSQVGNYCYYSGTGANNCYTQCTMGSYPAQVPLFYCQSGIPVIARVGDAQGPNAGICSAGYQTFYIDPTTGSGFQSGARLYLDQGILLPVSGYSKVSDQSGANYNLMWVSGVQNAIGGPDGTTC